MFATKNMIKKIRGMPEHLTHQMGAGDTVTPLPSKNVKKIQKKIKIVGNKITNFFNKNK